MKLTTRQKIGSRAIGTKAGALLLVLALSGCVWIWDTDNSGFPPRWPEYPTHVMFNYNVIDEDTRIVGNERVRTWYNYAEFNTGETLIARYTSHSPISPSGRYVAPTRTVADRMLINSSGKVVRQEGDPRIARQYAWRTQTQLENTEKDINDGKLIPIEPGAMSYVGPNSQRALSPMRRSIAVAKDAAAQMEGPKGGPSASPVTPMDLPTATPVTRPPHIDMPPT